MSVAPAEPDHYSAAADPIKLKIAVADRAATRKAGVEGLLLSLARTDSASGTKPVQVQVDYSSFRGAYGGDWASRLRLVQLPACALTSPEKSECRSRKQLVTANDTRPGTLTAEVGPEARASGAEVRGVAAAGATVLAATADAKGSSGDFKATPLEASGSWSAGALPVRSTGATP
ncbi:hypothetical protein ACFQ2B_11700 [Streptomyces stramineus]